MTDERMGIPENWSFNSPEVAKAFDQHVREQLPWYDLATGVVAHIARSYIPNGGVCLDIGASTGNIGRAISKTLTDRSARLVAVDNSPDMLARYVGPGETVIADVERLDLNTFRPDMIIGFLVLMFLPVKTRRDFIERMKLAVPVGGAVLILDKMQPAPGYLGSVLYRLTLAAKYEAGALPEDVIAKELSLSGVQRPMDPEELDGFSPVFRFGDFAGWLYERK